MKNKRIYIYISPVLVILIFTAITFGILNGLNKADSAVVHPTCTYCNNNDKWEVKSYNKDEHVLQCTVCKSKSWGNLAIKGESHAYDTKYYSKNNSVHYKKCTVCGYQLVSNHSGGTHSNNGKCTTCDTIYQAHTTKASETKTPTCTEDGYTLVNCTFTSCNYSDKKSIPKLGHSYSSTPSYYSKAATQHTPIYKCVRTGCNGSKAGTATDHSYTWKTTQAATCTTNGKKVGTCVCGDSKTQTLNATGHNYSSSPKSYTTNADGHKPVYACTNSGCTSTTEGSQTGHTYGEWKNIQNASCTSNGKRVRTCSTCGYSEYQTINSYGGHNYGNWSTQEATCTTNGKRTRSCSRCGNTETQTINALGHTGATHENGGKCTRCSTVYENHKKSTTILKYNTTVQGHVPVYSCMQDKCQETYLGEIESHKLQNYKDNNNGTHSANCSICNITLQEEHKYENNKCIYCNAEKKEEQCSHTYIVKSNSSQHWEECSKCKIVKPNSLATHKFTSYKPSTTGKHTTKCETCNYSKEEECIYENGVCKYCKATKQEKPEECVHTYIIKSDEKQHWEECSKCKEIKENSIKKHEIKDYIDNKDGTHTGKCSICEFSVTEKHSGSKKCDICNATLDNNANNDDNNNNSNNNGNNNNNNNNNDKNSTKDNTVTKDDKLPQTGINFSIISLTLSVITFIGVISLIKIRKYKGI